MNDIVQGSPLGAQETDVKEDYDPSLIRRIIATQRWFAVSAQFRFKDVELTGRQELPDGSVRQTHLIMRSPDGNYWELRVDNAGALSAVAWTPPGTQGSGGPPR